MPRTFIPLGEWLPDQGGFGNPGLVDCCNFIRSSSGDYTPSAGLASIDDANLAGTTDILYGIHVNQSDWGAADDYIYLGNNSATAANQLLEKNLTAGTLTARHPATASVPDTMWGWQFAGFGDITVATPGRGTAGTGPSAGKIPLYQSAPGATFANLHDGTSDYEPSFRFCFPLGERLVIANLAGLGSSGSSPSLTPDPNPNMVWWSATNNVRKFWDEASAPADLTGYQFLYDDAGPITGGIGGRDFALIFKRSAVWRMDFGGAFGFTFRPVAQVGTLYHNSIVRAGNDIYFWGPEGPSVMRYGQEYVPLAAGKVLRSLYDSGWPDYSLFGNLGATDFSATPYKLRGVWSQATGNVIWYIGPTLWLLYNVATRTFSYRKIPDNRNGFPEDLAPTMAVAAPLDFSNQVSIPDVIWAGCLASSARYRLYADSISDVGWLPTSSNYSHSIRTGFQMIGGEQRSRISGVRPIITRRIGAPTIQVAVHSVDSPEGTPTTTTVVNTAANVDRRGFIRTAGDGYTSFKSIQLSFASTSASGDACAETIAEFDGIELEYELEGGGGLVALRGQK